MTSAQMTRRTLVTAAPAVAVCGAAPAAQPDPFLSHYRQWIEARAEWYRLIALPKHNDRDTPEEKAAEDAEFDAFYRMAETIPTTQEGFAALAHVVWDWHGAEASPATPRYEEEVRKPQNRILLNLYCALSGGEMVPLTRS